MCMILSDELHTHIPSLAVLVTSFITLYTLIVLHKGIAGYREIKGLVSQEQPYWHWWKATS